MELARSGAVGLLAGGSETHGALLYAPQVRAEYRYHHGEYDDQYASCADGDRGPDNLSQSPYGQGSHWHEGEGEHVDAHHPPQQSHRDVTLEQGVVDRHVAGASRTNNSEEYQGEHEGVRQAE